MAYKHKEAFALMWYACQCGHRERIWNSRDGVTPYGGVPCPSCGGGMTHVQFHLDEPAPGHELRDGQLFFADGTPEEAVAIIERRIIKFAAHGSPIPFEIGAQLLDDAKNQTGEWLPGWPTTHRAT